MIFTTEYRTYSYIYPSKSMVPVSCGGPSVNIYITFGQFYWFSNKIWSYIGTFDNIFITYKMLWVVACTRILAWKKWNCWCTDFPPKYSKRLKYMKRGKFTCKIIDYSNKIHVGESRILDIIKLDLNHR